jgi:lipid-A-disaccharide synthase
MIRGIYLVAAEASGDALAADLIHALRSRTEVDILGVGGAAMADAGVTSRYALNDLAVLGLVDGLKAYPRAIRHAEAVAADIIATNPKVVVLIDSWGFTLRVAQRVRRRAPHIRLVKYVGPQVWATRPGRARVLAACVDHLICLMPNEVPFYEPFGLTCTVCGHPAIGRFGPGDGPGFRQRTGIAPDAPVLGLLLGSRPAEVRRTAPILIEAVTRLTDQFPGLDIVCVIADPVAAELLAQAPGWPFKAHLVTDTKDKDAAFAAMDVALAVSGTVTTELALQGAAVVVGYRLGWLTWLLADKFLFKAPFATIVNVVAGREVAPEFLQDRCTPEALAGATAHLLTNDADRNLQIAGQNVALAAMGLGGPRAQEIAADAVMAEWAKADRPG